MKTSQTIAETPKTVDASVPAVQAWIGFDWGHHENVYSIRDASGQVTEGKFAQSAEALHAWLGDLQKKFGGRTVLVGIEATRGAAINAFGQYPWLRIYPISGITSARYRKAFRPSGATDDLPDARILLELVRDHHQKLRPLEVQDSKTVLLNGLVEGRRHCVNSRTQVLNEITSLLRDYYPQVLELLEDLNTEMALDFLTRWPDLISLKATKPHVLRKFYHCHHVRRPELIESRLKKIREAVALTTDPSIMLVATMKLASLVVQVSVLREQVTKYDAKIKEVFSQHEEAHLFKNLPGAGAAMAPRLCVAFGTDRTLYPDAASLQKYVGVAPVREKSGRTVLIHWRLYAPKFRRQTFVEWAGLAIQYCPWSRAYYDRMKEKGKSYQAIMRALAFKWIRILWKCWHTRQPYDEARYLQQLATRKSPYAIPT